MSGDPAQAARARVRTPGKHIVMFIAAAAAIILGAMSILRGVDHAPALPFASGKPAAGAGEAGLVALEPFLVDLAPDNNGRTAYLRLAASIRLARGAQDAVDVDAAFTDIDARITAMLRGLSPEDFAGEEGMSRVRREMLRRTNLVLAPARAEDIVISDLVIQ